MSVMLYPRRKHVSRNTVAPTARLTHLPEVAMMYAVAIGMAYIQWADMM